MGKGENRSRGEIERSREGKEPKKKKKKGRGKTWRTRKKNRDRRLVRWVKGRVFGYKESQANNVLSHVSHGDPTTVAIVVSIAADHL